MNFSSIHETGKWGTFVEAIVDPISYLPYWWDPEANRFYQTLLFPGCIGGIDKDLCTIETTDEQVYRVFIISGATWSDGHEFTIDDIIFTYQDIVVSNFLEQPYLSRYQDIVISRSEEAPDELLFTFPTSTSDNRQFFTFSLLPAHIVSSLSLDDYVTKFSLDPVSLSCAYLWRSKDPNSIVFNLNSCHNTSLSYYQIKLFSSPEDLKKNIQKRKSMVSFYFGTLESPFYKLLGLKDTNYTTLFFNTESTKLSPRIQRSIAGFVNHHFRSDQSDHGAYIVPYEWLFDLYVTTGDNLAEYIQAKNPSLNYDNVMLEQWGVHILPPRFMIDRAQRKYAFYLNSTDEETIWFTIDTEDPVTNIRAYTDKSVRDLDIESTNENKQHRLTFTLWAGQQIQEWLNTITVEGTVLGKKQTIASIDLYFLGKTSSDSGEEINKLKILTLNNTISNYIRVQLQNIFEDNGLQLFFEFEIYDTTDEFLKAIEDGNYDIVLTSMQVRGLYDVYHTLASSSPITNPSRLHDEVLNQFIFEENRTQSRNIIADKMPFFILWQLLKPYHIHQDIDFVFDSETMSDLSIRDDILRSVSLVSHGSLQTDLLWDRTNFLNFLDTLSGTTWAADNSVLLEDGEYTEYPWDTLDFLGEEE